MVNFGDFVTQKTPIFVQHTMQNITINSGYFLQIMIGDKIW